MLKMSLRTETCMDGREIKGEYFILKLPIHNVLLLCQNLGQLDLMVMK